MRFARLQVTLVETKKLLGQWRGSWYQGATEHGSTTMIDSFIGGVLLWVDFNSLDLAVGNNDEAREQNSDNETKEPSSPKQ